METPLQEALPCGRETDPFRGDVPALETKYCENKVTCQARGWACWKMAPPCAWGAARVSPACRAYHRVTWSRGGRQVHSRYSPRVMGTDSSYGGGRELGSSSKAPPAKHGCVPKVGPPRPVYSFCLEPRERNQESCCSSSCAEAKGEPCLHSESAGHLESAATVLVSVHPREGGETRHSRHALWMLVDQALESSGVK